MARKIRSYESDKLTVDFDARRCIHAEECVHGLPGVFDASRRPWIDPNAATAAELVRVIERCPTGALQYRWRDDAAGEQPPPTNTFRVGADGPLYVHGRLRVALADGDTLEESRVALCRCGHSADKPFCDNSHREAGFSHDGEFSENRLVADDQQQGEVVEVSFAKNGPILVRGLMRLVTDSGVESAGKSGALCRCGHSATKPFCDGAHKAAGFEGE